jgi:cellulose synthase/poly-beta-1,6-N-acetylglucosamine synthase-like glycosyltransferase
VTERPIGEFLALTEDQPFVTPDPTMLAGGAHLAAVEGLRHPREKQGRAAALHQLSHLSAVSTDLERSLNQAVVTITALGHDAVGLWVIEAGGVLRRRGAHGHRLTEELEIAVADRDPIVDRALRSSRPTRASAGDARHAAWRPAGDGEVVLVPLVAPGTMLGLLVLARARPYDDADIELASRAADFVAEMLRRSAERLDHSVNGLLRSAPQMSAVHTLSRGEAWVLFVGAAAVVAGLFVRPLDVLIAVEAAAVAAYLVVTFYSVLLFRAVLRRPPVVAVSDEEARAVPDHDLPTYTVLVAAYREAEVIPRTIAALESLDYPRDRIELKLLLEADDSETYAAAVATPRGPEIEIVRVPPAEPRTKPKACNFGLSLSRGELVTIFDAEDRPDPLQLRRAAVAFKRLDPKVACLQAKLHFHNVAQNLLTRWFAAEYVTWFSGVLPAVVALGAPVPLGGTSMHVRRAALEEVGGWDPHNVTEDADLGVRLARSGYHTEVLDSVTFEEANSDFINWTKQRSRWYKGYLQTWLVHMRDPVRLWRELGPAGFLGFNFIVGSTPILALTNPPFWLLTWLWFLGRPSVIQELFPPWLFYPALFSLVVGNFIALYRGIVGVRLGGYPALVFVSLVAPLYWLLMSIAAVRALIQLVVKPTFWEKTVHGLDARAGWGGSHVPHS